MSMFSTSDINSEVWLASGGAMLVLLRSILDGTRRSWYALLTGCILGGAGSVIAGTAFAGSNYVYFWCGVAAVVCENVVLGLFNASKEFRDAPIKVFAQIWKIVMPSYGKNGLSFGTATAEATPVSPAPNPDEVPAG
jgi:hypothetical protein